MLFYEVLLMINLRKLSLMHVHVQVITSMYDIGMYLLTHAPSSTAALLKRRSS